MSYGGEEEKIMLDVSRAGRAVKTMLMIGNPATILLLTFLKRMVNQKLLKVGKFEKIESFINATKGNYDIVNVPVNDTGAIQSYWAQNKIEKELEAMGISFSILPDLNKGDGIIQIAVADKDKGKFSAWFSRHIVTQMKGGEKELNNLQNLTDGQVSIISFPFENREHLFKEDFEKLGINYSVLPDLNVGDNDIQLYVANSDLQKVEHWFSMYKNECIRNGEEAPDMQVMNAAQYMNTGRINEEQYQNTADETVKSANAEYENKDPGEIEQAVMQQQIRSVDDEAYVALDNNPDFVKVTINKEALVDKSSVASKQTNNNYFASRVPGTWKDNERTLILPKEQVFETDNGQTYIAFIPRNTRPIVLDANAKPVSVTERPTGELLMNKHYASTNRTFKDMESLAKKDRGATPEPKARLNPDNIVPPQWRDNDPIDKVRSITDKIPTNPVKSR